MKKSQEQCDSKHGNPGTFGAHLVFGMILAEGLLAVGASLPKIHQLTVPKPANW